MLADDANFAPTRFSTDALPVRERLPRWREEFGRTLVHVDIAPLAPDAPFQAQATLRALPGVRLVSCVSSLAQYDRTPALAAGGDDSIGLIVNLGPKAIATQRKAEVMLDCGDAVLVRTDEAGKLTGARHLGIVFPSASLEPRIVALDRAMMRPVPHQTAALWLLVNYLTLVQADVALGSPGMRQTVVNHIYDLAALALGANRETKESGLPAVAAARLAAALSDIQGNFAQPGLTLTVVAQRQGVSPRYLQKLLEQSGMSFTAHVNELRLNRAFALLTDSDGDRARISEIALSVGFSDISHFNRSFRSRFGDTPKGVRCK
jgi:AraC-like DNA-binding protein